MYLSRYCSDHFLWCPILKIVGCIHLAHGELLKVVVTDVVDPGNISVQPHSKDLVDLMNKLG